MTLTLGFSPCPNDTFIFDALVNKKIDTEGLDFDVKLEDVQTLNEWALNGKLDFSKISYGVLPLLLPQYRVLSAGGALGKGVGPLLVANSVIAPDEIHNCRVAIPGKNTTAHLLFSLAYPDCTKKEFKVFHEIENWLLQPSQQKNAAGVIIHENRFTYLQKGLIKLEDLGEYWEKKTGLPIPLGGIVAKRTVDKALIQQVNRIIQKSIDYSWKNYPDLSEYVALHAQEMQEDVMKQHINLYVNEYSMNLGKDGEKAVRAFIKIYQQLYPNSQVPIDDLFA